MLAGFLLTSSRSSGSRGEQVKMRAADPTCPPYYVHAGKEKVWKRKGKGVDINHNWRGHLGKGTTPPPWPKAGENGAMVTTFPNPGSWGPRREGKRELQGECADELTGKITVCPGA